MGDELETLTATICTRRRYGKTTCVVRTTAIDSSSLAAALDAFVASFGFRGMGEDWIEVNTQGAKVIATTVLQKDLAYSVAVMSEGEAQRLADSFLFLFQPDLRAFTNGNLIIPDADPSEVANSWNPITPATFDTGVICAGGGKIGILWVEDED